VIFPPLPVDPLVEELGDMEPVHHRPGVGQQVPAGVVKGLPHVGPVRLHLLPLLRREVFQAFPGRRLIPALRHGQHRRPVGVRQVGQDRDVQPVPLLQAQLVDPDVRHDPFGGDLLSLGVRQLVTNDQGDGFGRDAEPAGDVRLGAADQRPQDVLLEPVGVAHVPPLERRDQVLAVVAERAPVEGGRVDPEAGLAPDVQVSDDLHRPLVLDPGRLVPAAAGTPVVGGERPGDLEAMAFPIPVIARDRHTVREIDVDGDLSHGRP
jgi:hypothetical protein